MSDYEGDYKKMLDMPLNTVKDYKEPGIAYAAFKVTRVPGGWIYTFTKASNSSGGGRSVHSVFVAEVFSR